MEIFKKNNKIYNFIFIVYLLLILVNSYYYLSEISYSHNSVYNKPPGDLISIHKYNYSDNSTLSIKEIFFRKLIINNVIFNSLSLFTSDYYFNYNFTPIIILIISLLLIYNLGCFKGNKLYGLLAAFIFSTLPITIIYSKLNIYHLSESMYVLFSIYFFFKSDNLKKIGYSILYINSLIFVICSAQAIRSGIIYVAIMLFLNGYFLKEEKRYKFLNFMLVTMVLSLFFFYLKTDIETIEKFKTYIAIKIPSWCFKSYGLHSLFSYIFWGLPLKLQQVHLYPFYFYLFLFLFLYDILLLKNKKDKELCMFINFLIIVPLLIHILLFDRTEIDDVFIIFPLMSLKAAYVCFYINEQISVGKLKDMSSIWIPVYYKILNIAKKVLVLLIFFYGILSTTPIEENTVLRKISNYARIKNLIYISDSSKQEDFIVTDTYSYLYSYLNILLEKQNISTPIFIIGIRDIFITKQIAKFISLQKIESYLACRGLNGIAVDLLSLDNIEDCHGGIYFSKFTLDNNKNTLIRDFLEEWLIKIPSFTNVNCYIFITNPGEKKDVSEALDILKVFHDKQFYIQKEIPFVYLKKEKILYIVTKITS